MAELISDDKPLPQFRKDLEIYEGPLESDGSPTFNLYDPVRAKFFKINWGESLIIKYLKPGMTLNDLLKVIQEKTTLKASKDDVKYFFFDAFRQDLLAVMKSSKYFEDKAANQGGNPFLWLLMNYLYIRIPLVNPDKFLTKTIKYVRLLGSGIALTFFVSICLLGAVLLMTRFKEFLNTLTYFFNFEGVIIYASAITMVKVVHELSHAYSAKSYNVYVPSMGIAFIVLWPVLYTDVSDGWKLKSRRDRFFISAAGIIAETLIAGFASFGWYFTSEGLLQSVFFVIASVTWVSTLLINLNPAVRFDGYYILADLSGIDNLQVRSFNVARWKLRDWLLGLKTPPPEELLSKNRITGMVVYATYTWIYRVILYTTIAVFVYYKFTKAIGAFLFFLEIGVFLVWPIVSEIKAIVQLKERLSLNPKAFFTVIAILLGAAWFILPLPHQIKFPAVTVPVNFESIYIPSDAFIEKIYVKRNQELKAGDPIIKLRSPSLEAEITQLKLEEKILNKEIYLLGFRDEDRPYIPEKVAELASKRDKYLALKDKNNQLLIRAGIPGKLYFWEDTLYPDLAVSQDRVIGKIANINEVDVIAYVPEEDLETVHVGEEARFRIQSTNDLFKGKVVSITPLRTLILKHPALSSVYQGALAVTQDPKTDELRMVDSYYMMKIHLDEPEAQIRFEQTGVVEVDGPWRSRFGMLFRRVLQIFWRESGV